MFTKKDFEMAARMVRILATTGDSAGATLLQGQYVAHFQGDNPRFDAKRFAKACIPDIVIRPAAGATIAVSEPAKRMKRTADTRKLQSESAKAVWAKRKAAKSEAQKAASAAAKAAIAKRWDRVRLEAKQVA